MECVSDTIGENGCAIVVEDQSEAMLLEILNRAHVHSVLVVTEIELLDVLL